MQRVKAFVALAVLLVAGFSTFAVGRSIVRAREDVAAMPSASASQSGQSSWQQHGNFNIPKRIYGQINSTQRISIPYGFEATLPILTNNYEVLASGHGGCSAGQEVTIAVTISQPISGGQAVGETEKNCNGELQTWWTLAASTSPGTLVDGTAEACGVAETNDQGVVTDTFEWCREVELAILDQHIFLPIGPIDASG